MVSITLVLVIACVFFTDRNVHADETVAYRFGVFPYVVPARLEKLYTPVSVEFSKVLGRRIHFRTAINHDTFSQKLREGEFDIALISPFDVVPMIDERRYIGLARRPSHPAVLVALPDSEIQSIDDIKKQSIGMPPNNSPATVFLTMTLKQKRMTEDNLNIIHYPNPLACLHRLLVGEVAICGTGGGATQQIFERRMGIKLIKVMETESFPHMLFIVNPRIPEQERDILKQIILTWTDSDRGRALLRNIGRDAKFIPFSTQDYDIVRQYRKAWLSDVEAIN